MKRFVRLTSPALAALLFLVINPTAHATRPPPGKKLVGTVRVSYADLDLTQQTDVQILLDRIEKAAHRACGGNPRRHPGYGLMPNHIEEVFNECREDAIVRAVGEIDSPVLAQARLEPTGK